jgi:hypothetical protein
MASLRQIDANRRNALKSTGPRTDDGKRRARRNAFRHGLTAETVLEILEDPEDYKAFELSVTADFDAQTAVERELVLRLASLLWRLRRAIAVETGLLHMHAESEIRQHLSSPRHEGIVRLGEVRGDDRGDGRNGEDGENRPMAAPYEDNLKLAGWFLRLTTVDNGAFDRLHRYETALWRQAGQILFMLDALQGRTPFRRKELPTYLGPRR